MRMEYEIATVALKAINPTDRSFRISTTHDKPSLFRSIRDNGLLVPPALQRRGADWIIVSGFRRVKACIQTGHNAIAARLLADHLTPLDCLRIAIIENNSQRALNLVESARAVNRLKNLCAAEEDLLGEMERLGLPATRKMIARLLGLNQLEDKLQTAIVEGSIGPGIALALGAMPGDDREAVHALFTRIPMSVGKQRDILNLAQDIAGRDGTSVAAVLHDNRIRALVDDRERDGNSKTADIRKYLRNLCFPNLSAAERRYQTALSKLKLGPHMRIDHPEGFEGLIYTLSLRFKTIDDLNRAHRKLGHAIQNPAISELFLK